MSELRHLLYGGTFDLLLITETWLHDGISTGLLDPEGKYHVLRKDRTHSRGGGVCVFVSRNLHVVRHSELELICFIMWIKLNYAFL